MMHISIGRTNNLKHFYKRSWTALENPLEENEAGVAFLVVMSSITIVVQPKRLTL